MKKILTLFTALILFGSMTVKADDTWTPAGEPASVFTAEWTPNTPANDMTLSNGLYVFAKRSDFSETSISFKVCKNHAWTTAYPGSNYGFTIPNGSKYLIITYKTSGNAVNAFAISSMTVAGEPAALFGNDTWTPSATANDMTLQNDGTYKFEKTGVALSAGTVKFKACANHGWDNAWPSANYELSIPEDGEYTITITFDPNTLSVSASADLEEPVVVIPNIQLHSNIKNPSWESTAYFDVAGNNETASLTLTGVTKGNYEFGVKIDGSWTSNGSGFTRDNNSHAVVAGSGNCTFNADRNGDYTFTWTYASNTLEIGYPAIPAQSVSITGLASQILKGTEVTFTASSTGIDEPGYLFYVKEKDGSFGSAVESYTFDAIGEYVVKVEALEYNSGDPVTTDVSNVVIYDEHTFASGTTIYVDFSAVDAEEVVEKMGVNYPKVNEVGIDYDATGAGTIKAVTFTADVTWNTMADAFIKTAKAGWAALKFSVPGAGKNCAIVAADGASYAWGTHVPTVKAKGSWDEWADALEFTGDATSVSVTKHLAKGDHEFKLIIGEDWRGNGYTYHRDYTGASDIISNGDNMKIEADVEGYYTFTWTFADNAINITFPECDYYIKNNWYGCGAWKWKGMTPAGNGTYRIENVVYGGNGVNYNTTNDDAGATWKAQSVLFYMDGNKRKEVTAYDTVNFVLDPANDTIWAEMVSKDLTVYTVGSNSLALCDLGWAATHPHKYTDMKKQEDGTYKWTKSDEEVVLLAGDVYIKVFKDRDEANGYWPTTEEGQACNIAQSGIYTIEVDFNPCTHDITITPTLVKALNIQNLILQGSWDQKPLVLDGNNAKALATLPLTVGTHNFQLLDGGNNKYGDGEAFTREHNSYREIVPKAGSDMTIEVDEAGEYLFTYIFETDQLVVSYPAIVPVDRISPIGGKFTINAKGDTAIFARGNLQYNYGANAWYAAEKQYEVLSDLNLRFGDDNYEGSVDVFGWSCEDSNYGLLKSNLDVDFTGDFVDWGTKFTDDEKVWNTLTRGEWDFLLNRTKNDHKLWAIIALGPDSLNGLALFPDDWEDLAGLTIAYGFYNLDDEETLKANSFSFAQWDELEAAGAVFLPLAGARAGFVGNTIGIDGSTTTTKNPLSGWYCWMDNVSEYGFYWLATNPAGKPDEADMLVAPWLNSTQTEYTRPVTTTRPRRYGHAVRLVTRIPKAEHTVVRENLNPGHYYTICYPKAMTDIQGATLWSFIGKDTHFAYIQQETASTIEAGKPYIMYATASTVQAILGDETNAPGANGAIHGTFSDLVQEQLDNFATVAGNDLYLVIGDELRRATGAGTGSNTLPAQRAFVVLGDIPAAPAQMPAHVRSMPLHKDATQGFENLDASEKPIKVLIDGQLYILRGENIYNVNGQIVQ